MLLKRRLATYICLFVVLAAESLPINHPISAQTSIPITLTVVPSQQSQVFTGMNGVTFLDAQHGWMFAGYQVMPNYESLDTVDATTDGGRTWQTRSVLCPSQTKLCPANRGNDDPVLSLRFVNTQDGWAFGPGLFATHDGGVTWQQVNVSGDIMDLTIVEGTVQALQYTCSTTVPVHCTYALLRSMNNGQTWQARALPSAIIGAADFTPLDSQNLYLLGRTAPDPVAPQSVYGGDDNQLFDKQLLLSSNNGGLTWHASDIPYQCSDTWDYVAVIDAHNLWLACGWILGAGAGLTWVYTSSDGGVSWQMKPEATSASSEDNVISSSGYLQNIYAFSTQSAWVTFRRAPPMSTNDGGKSWHEINGLGDFEQGISVIHLDDQHIWIYSPDLLLGTSDGGLTWVCQRANYDYGDGWECAQLGSATDPRNATPYPQP